MSRRIRIAVAELIAGAVVFLPLWAAYSVAFWFAVDFMADIDVSLGGAMGGGYLLALVATSGRRA